MTQPPCSPRRNDRSVLESAWLAAALAIVVLALGAVVLLPGLLRPFDAVATPTPATAGQPTPSGPTPSATFVRPTPSPQPTFLSHLVRSGDSLNSIAREYRTTARSIAWWNRGTYPSLDPESGGYDPNRLQVGWVLRVLPDTVVDDSNPPPASPAPIGRPAPTPRPSNVPQPAATPGPAAVIAHGPRTARTIALTFDMGGRLDPAVGIVQWLIDHEVHATLFPTGEAAQSPQGLAAMRLAATRPDLFDFANHSWDHPDFRGLSRVQMAEQLTRTEIALAPVVGTTKPWFRPPFGGWNDDVLAGVGAAGWSSVVVWDIDTIDWRPEDNGDGPAGPTAPAIVAKVAENARGGSIVLMHLGGWHTLEALPGILEVCSDLGLEPVTLTEMLGS